MIFIKKYAQIYLILLLSSIVVITGCTNQKENDYEGGLLRIAVVGTSPTFEHENVQFEEIDIDYLFEEAGAYDALFVMEETFTHTSKGKYAKLYKGLPYPTFFIGLSQPHEAFTDENLTILDFEEGLSQAFAQGYYRNNNGTNTWTFVPSNPLKTKDEYRSMYIKIFNEIDEFRY